MSAGHDEWALRARLVEQVLAELPPRQRDVLRMRVLLRMSTDSVAVALGSTPAAVRLDQHRALTALRRRLGAPP